MFVHSIPPVFDKNSEVLILGSFPSVKSREQGFFYGHKQNRFWRVLAEVFGCAAPDTIAQKREFLLSHRIAVWDVIGSCDISGSADGSIKNVTPNDLSAILRKASIRKIFVNGKAAEKYYNKYVLPRLRINASYLPSTSPANAACSLESLVGAWRAILD